MQALAQGSMTPTSPSGRGVQRRGQGVTVQSSLDLDKLEILLRAFGIGAEFIDFGGNTIHTPLENRLRVLASMGIVVENAQQLETLLQEQRAEGAPGFRVPVRVVEAGQPFVLPLWLAAADADCQWRLELEDGTARSGRFRPADLPAPEGQDDAGAGLLALDAVPPGYHRLELDDACGGYSVEIISAPARIWQPPELEQGARLWGLSAQLYTLRSQDNWGIGDFGDLEALCRAAAGLGADFLLLNPLHCPDPGQPENASPYSPDDRRFINPWYLHLPACDDFAHASVQRLVNASDFRAELARVRDTNLVDYAAVVALKSRVLLRMFDAFKRRTSDDSAVRAFRDFLTAEGQTLADFAAFQSARFTSEGGAMADSRFHAWLQWQAGRQLAACQQLCRQQGMRIGIVQDMAVGSNAEGCEVQTSLAGYCLQARIGAPPDYFNPLGQNWGLPPLRPDTLAHDGARFFRRLLQANMRGSGALRIDHVMSLMRLWWCPEDGSNADGAYVYYPVDLLFAILRLESQRHKCLVIGEDLGVVPPEIRHYLDSAGVFSNCLFYFEKYDGWHFRLPEHYKPRALAMITNHDVPPLDCWWYGKDLDLRYSLGLIPDEQKFADERQWRHGEKGEILAWLQTQGLLPASWQGAEPDRPLDAELKTALARACGRVASQLVSVQLDDLAGADSPVNIPGTHRQYPNWRRKLPLETAAIFDSTMALGMMKALHAGRHE